MTPVPIPCSRSAHDQNVLARRPQWDQHGCHSLESETSKLGRIIERDEDRSMHAVKGHFRPPSGWRGIRRLDGLTRGLQRPSPGRMVRLGVPMGGRVRRRRAVEPKLSSLLGMAKRKKDMREVL